MTNLPFAPQVYEARLQEAQRLTEVAGFDALIVGPGPDLEYLVGFRGDTHERFTGLVIPVEGEVTVVMPVMEESQFRTTAVGALDLRVFGWVDGQDPYEQVARATGGVARVGVSDSLPALHLIPISNRLDVSPELATPVLREARMVKSVEEIAELRLAGQAIDRVHERVPGLLRAGRTEREVGEDLSRAILEEGHMSVAFVIVGAGEHGADPHHGVSDRVLQEGDIVVVDIGGEVPTGYFSDCTRTYVVGEPHLEAARKIGVLEEAQRAAVAAVKPGVTAAQIDAAARDLLTKAGLGEAFVHRTGHGIGVSLHEEPFIAPGNDLPVREGMVFSIEPGIYLPGEWGARIEDIVVVTATGCERLNVTPRGLTPATEPGTSET